jgi:hypothetical protein
MDYTFYDPSNGAITFTMSSPTKPDKSNGPYIKGSYNPKEFIIIEGAAVKKSDAEIEAADKKNAWVELRKRRHALLLDSDWTQVPDAPVDREAWAVYRQQLRDLPKNTTDPRNPVWPTTPA